VTDVNHDDRPAIAGMSDEALLADLRRVVSTVDGPPDSVVAAARAAFLARDLDGELAVLTADSRAPGDDAYDRVRAGTAEPAQGRWLLSFCGGGVQVDMEVEEHQGRLRLIGQLLGSSEQDCFLESVRGRMPIEVDELGRFIVTDVLPGPVRLRCRSADGRVVTTAWVAV
jgi:hypothetical protein